MGIDCRSGRESSGKQAARVTVSAEVSQGMNNRKSVLLSLVLTFFFGPFGMLYSTVVGAVVMLVLYVALGIPTLGWAIAGLHPIAMVWGAWAAHRANG